MTDAARAAHHQKMTQTPVPLLIGKLAVPTIVSMLITSVYSMADTAFVARLGTSATGAVGIVFSLMAIIQAFGFMLGMGGGNVVARQLGAKEDEAATVTASTAFFSAIIFGLALCVLGSAFRTPFMRFLGATETILPYAESYAQYILLAAPVMCASFVLNNILRGEGKANLAMVGITIGGVLNIALDPIFIFGLNLGIAGAAIATALSQTVSFLILLSFFLRGKSGTRIRISKVSFLCKQKGVLQKICITGMPSLCRQGLASIATMLLNVTAAGYGDAVVAAMSVVARIFMFAFSVMLGFGQGFQPVAGYNWGAQRYDRVRKATVFTMQVGTLIMSAAAVIGFWLAPVAMALFRPDDTQVIAVGALAFRAQCLALPLFGISTAANMALQATGHSKQATLLSMCRQGLFFIPLIFLLPQLIGLLGVQIAQALADFFTCCVCVPFLVSFFKKLKQKEATQLAAATNE